MTADESGKGFSAQERAAMKERAAELRAEAKRAKAADKAAADLADVLAKIEDMPEPDRGLAMRIHEIVTKAGPELAPSTWYGMPAYKKDGKVVCFFQSGQKYDSRLCTFGFQDKAELDDGAMWPMSYAVVEIGDKEEQLISALVKKALG